MKKKYYLMALAGLLMVSCNEDNDPFNNATGGGGSIGTRELSFVFPGTAQGVVPYAVTALPEENELSTLDIYVFGVDSMSGANPKPMVLEEIFRSGQGYALTTTGTDRTAKISLPSGNNKAIFFVANAREHLSLDSVELHVTDTATFKARISNTLKGHIACPMLMSAQLDMPDVKAAVDAANTAGTGVQVELTRRVARFDIKNNSETSNFVIDKVVLGKVPGNVSLFPKTYTAPIIDKMPLIDFSAMKNSNAGITNSVFYMYPIKMTTGEEVELTLAGTNLVTNLPQTLDVVFKSYKDQTTINVEANNRYLIEVEDLGSGELEATLKVLDWIVGDTVNVNTGDGTIKLSSADGRFGKSILRLAAEPTLAADSVSIAVAADGEWELIVEDQYKSWIGVSALPGDAVMKEFKVTTLLPNPSSKEERQGVVMVQNVRRPSIRQPLVIKQAANTTRYLDLSGMAIAGNLLAFSGETAGDSLNVKVTAPVGTSWKATKTASWFTFGDEATGLKAAATDGSIFDGTGEATFSIVPTAHTDKDKARVDTITITIAKSGAETTDLVQTLIVRQAPQNLGTILVKCIGLSADGKVGIPANGFTDKGTNGQHVGERMITVNATTEWKVVIPVDAMWLTQEGGITLVQGSQNGSFYLKAAANTAVGAAIRTATVRIVNTKDATIYQDVTFTQAADPQVPADALELAASSLSWANNETGAKTIDVTTASSNWTLGTLPSWLTATATTGGVDDDIALTLNTSGVNVPFFADQTATIDVTVGNVTKQITVTWNAETVTLGATDPSEIAVAGNVGSAVSVAVACNDGENWTVSKEDGADWLTVTKNGANVEVEAAEYIGGIADRTATVTITSDSQSGVTKTFTVTQVYQ